MKSTLYSIGIILALVLVAIYLTVQTPSAQADAKPAEEYSCVAALDVVGHAYLNLADSEHHEKFRSYVQTAGLGGWKFDHLQSGPGGMKRGLCLSRPL